MNLSDPIISTSITEATLLDNLTLNIKSAWNKIAPTWPLQSVIARNPLYGLEHLDFNDAIKDAAQFFESDFNNEIELINAQTIKWCLAYFDKGQATICMPGRNRGLYNAWKDIAIYDNMLFSSPNQNRKWLSSLSDDPMLAIKQCLTFLKINTEYELSFITTMLVTLPGWAGYVKYLVNYANITVNEHQTSFFDYLAFRLAITCLIWPKAVKIIDLVKNNQDIKINNELKKIEIKEAEYRGSLIKSLQNQAKSIDSKVDKITPQAQLVFCIDVRSEPFRRAIEANNNYQTYGFAGFFGIPVSIKEYEQIKACCPVLIKPKHIINHKSIYKNDNSKLRLAFYQTLKYNFMTTFALVETLGPWLGLYMAIKTIAPWFTVTIKNYFSNLFTKKILKGPCNKDIMSISFSDRCNYAKNALCMIGLTNCLAPLILLCGHGSSTVNNADASSLDCGACGGHHGGINAQILATILNQTEVRTYLAKNNINITDKTQFIAGEHNTTTDEVTIYDTPKIKSELNSILIQLRSDLKQAKNLNSSVRFKQLGATETTKKRSADWSQTRPEWGLAKNASFIIGDRNLTKNIDLQGRSFLHSYNWEIDKDGTLLETILTAPMIVAQWINTQYLFSTINNAAYGSGSKITQNIACKIGIMQGNASDLRYGLSLQSVKMNTVKNYHEPLRLFTIIYAPILLVDTIIKRQTILQKLFGNNWVALAVIDPESKKFRLLRPDLSWQEL